MDHDQARGRHRRRRNNRAARAAFDEARRAGLVRRHLIKLQYLAERGKSAPAPAPDPVTEPSSSTSDAA
ncbi:hypothetical protein ACWEVP_15615 [Amycolatopsis sp. NPDC003865]